MAKLIIAVLIILSSMLIADTKAIDFYFHDTVSGENPTSVNVARPNNNNTSPIAFGLTYVFDDPLTSAQDPNSAELGRAQGIYAQASVTGPPALLFMLNFVFTSGKYNGSTLSVLGQNPFLEEYREMPVVGGTGVFRLARGIATAHNAFNNFTTFDAIVEFHVVALHY